MDDSQVIYETKQFVGASLQISVWILRWRLAVQQWLSPLESERREAARLGWELVQDIEVKLHDVGARVENFERAIIRCDPSGSHEVARFDSKPFRTAHSAIVAYLDKAVCSLADLVSRTDAAKTNVIPPVEFMAWMESQLLQPESDLVCRVEREREYFEKEYGCIYETTPTRAGRKPKGEKLTEELMMEILESKPESQFWKITEWMQATGRSKGSIGGCHVWLKLESLRMAVKAERRLNASERAIGSKRRR